jgi:L-lactate dehydrogenase complex protein LldG
VIVISQKAIVATMVEAIPLISTATSILVTGPSRTADIEGILVKGVHGPGELLVYVYE